MTLQEFAKLAVRKNKDQIIKSKRIPPEPTPPIPEGGSKPQSVPEMMTNDVTN